MPRTPRTLARLGALPTFAGAPAEPRLRRASQAPPDWGAASGCPLQASLIGQPVLHLCFAGLVGFAASGKGGSASRTEGNCSEHLALVELAQELLDGQDVQAVVAMALLRFYIYPVSLHCFLAGAIEPCLSPCLQSALDTLVPARMELLFLEILEGLLDPAGDQTSNLLVDPTPRNALACLWLTW